ncbi:MAG TPA: YihY family inner membrane protein [Burkholderiales bacterium]|nr:YihY family inner membrane protein [Burkholderiales bacterium]
MRFFRGLKRALTTAPPQWEFLRAVTRRFREDRCAQVAGSLTFTTLLALVPLMTVALTVVTAFPVFASLSEALREFIVANFVPDAASQVITIYLPQFSDNAAKLTGLGVAFLAVTAIMLALTIDRAFNIIWRVKRPRPLAARVLLYWAVLTIGPLLIGGGLTLSSGMLKLLVSLGLDRELWGYAAMLLGFVPLALTSFAFALLYRAVPNRQVLAWDAAVGGILAGLAFETTKLGFGEFVAHFSNHRMVYGTFASVPLFLLWIYISWLVVLSGAIVTAALPNWRARGFSLGRDPASQFVGSVKLLKLLAAAHQKGELLALDDLSRSLGFSWEATEPLLDRLEAAGWVCKVAGAGWVLRRDSERIKLSEVFRNFVFDPEAASGSEDDRELTALVRATASIVDRELDVVLASFFEPGGARHLRAIERVG